MSNYTPPGVSLKHPNFISNCTSSHYSQGSVLICRDTATSREGAEQFTRFPENLGSLSDLICQLLLHVEP